MALIVSLWLTLLPFQDKPDRIVLENGDTLTGTVLDARNGTLRIKTAYAKEIRVEMKQVREIRTGKPAWIRMRSGELFLGTLETEPSGKIRIRMETPGDGAVFDWDRIRAINPDLHARYRGKIRLGSNIQTGNSDRTSLSLGADAEREGMKDHLTFRFRWNYAEEERKRTTRNVFTSVKYDYFFYDDWEREEMEATLESTYLYLSSELFSDEFRDLDLRTIAGAGVGFEPITEKDLLFSIEGGLSYLFESYSDGTEDHYVTARVNVQVKWLPWEHVTIRERLTLFPGIEESAIKIRNEASLSWKLGGGWGLDLSSILDHNSRPVSGVDKTDHQLLLSLQFVFG